MLASTRQDEVVDLDRLIQEDPNLPSLAYQAHENVPIFLPWSSRFVALGTGLDSSVACSPQPEIDVFRQSALSSSSGPNMYQLEAEEGSSSFRQSSSAQAATSYEHMDFK